MFKIKVDYAVITAMQEELAPYLKIFKEISEQKIQGLAFKICEYNGRKILLSSIGFGTTSAAIVTTLIVTHFQPDYILFSGTAGGIGDNVKVNDVVIAAGSFQAEMQAAFSILPNTPFESCLTHPVKHERLPEVYKVDSRLLTAIDFSSDHEISIHYGTIVSSDIFPAPPPEIFKDIQNKHPLAIDMETSALYQIGWLLQIPVLVIRGISNKLNSEGKDENIDQADVPNSSANAAKVLLKVLHKLIEQQVL